jgi:hypothetical protein
VVFFCLGCPLFGLLVLLFSCHFPLLRLLLLLVVRVLVFIVITVVKMDMWKLFATESGKLRRLKLSRSSWGTGGTSSRGSKRSSATSETWELPMLLRQSSPYTPYVARSCWFCDSALCTYRFCYCFSVFHFGTTFHSFSLIHSILILMLPSI